VNADKLAQMQDWIDMGVMCDFEKPEQSNSFKINNTKVSL